MARILLLAATTGYQTRSFAEAAHRLGIDVVLATDRCHIIDDPWGDHAIAIRFDEPQESAARVTDYLRTHGISIDGLIAVADRPTLIAALVAERLGIPWHPPSAAAVCRDKHQMRVRFQEAGLPVPHFTRASLESNPRQLAGAADFPCVLKPLSLSGSRGVIRADHCQEFVRAFERIRQILARPEFQSAAETSLHQAIQIEQYIPGREFAVEGVMREGRLHPLAIFDKPDPLEGPFFEETIYVTPSREPVATQQAILGTVSRAAEALGLFNGPIHAEMRANASGVYMLEIAARPIGGLCARVLRFRTPQSARPLSLEELLILHATGNMPSELTPAVGAAGVMMIPVPRAGILQSVEGIEEARAAPGIEEVVITAKPGEKLVPLPEGASYTGFIFASAADPRAAEDSLRKAHAALRFGILSALDVLS